MFNDFFNLIFPHLCAACNEALLKNEQVICTACQINLPKTNHHLDKTNSLNQIFWGRITIEMAGAYYQFDKKSSVQHLLHQLKYKGHKEVGVKIGELYGMELKESIHYTNIDLIIPVPLHGKKLKKRGYNQSEFFAKGLATQLGVTMNTNCLYRKINSDTQTNKGRYPRWENVRAVFEVKDGEMLRNKSILLVDDVITTGSTIEACASVLQEYNCTIYVAAIAFSSA
ncbi:MAG: ComF family protein [Vicingus serpentipes]|nr:ComF family protein [Vicingus serpentipes]